MNNRRPESPVLFLTPCFLSRRLHKKIRGVEVFDLLLVRQLVERGVDVVVAAESSWKGRFAEHLAGAMPRMIWTPSLRKPLPNGVVAALAAALGGAGRFGTVVIGNDTKGMIPAMRILRAARRGARFVVIAHKAPHERFLREASAAGARVVAVNGQIAEMFRGAVGERATAYYGLPNGDEFFPSAERARKETVDFVLLGKLDNPWKGAERAIGAVMSLEGEARRRARLHLAAYAKRPAIEDPGIVFHEWMPAGAIAGFLREMDVMLVPSTGRAETFSQAMVQGMLTGLPVIASDEPAMAEKLDTGGGLVVRDDAGLRAAIARLTMDEGERRRMGEAARRTALERYVWDTGVFIERWLT